MIKVIGEGKYKLIETKDQTKVLILDRKKFAWINAKGIGEILVATYKPHKLDCILSLGNYKLFEVKEERNLTDLMHLELFVGEGKWQGYLLTTGLPTKKELRKRIIPTNELITKNQF